jgi:hypothetical protein
VCANGEFSPADPKTTSTPPRTMEMWILRCRRRKM